MFSAGTWLRTHQSSHKKFRLLEQCRDKMATAREGSFSPEFLQKTWRPASEWASPEALWLILPCSSQHFTSSAPLARQVLCVFIRNTELWLPRDKNKMFPHTPGFGKMLNQGSGFAYVAITGVKSYCRVSCAARCKGKTCFLLSWKPAETVTAKEPPRKAALLEPVKYF